jgi:hypothetical protein
MTRRGRFWSFGAAAVMVAAGAACATTLPAGLGSVSGLVLVGLGLVVAVSLVFLEVGLSEDRERAGARADAGAVEPELPPGNRRVPPRPERLGRPPLHRRRGSSRRIDR